MAQAVVEERARAARERELETARLRAQQQRAAHRQSGIDELCARRCLIWRSPAARFPVRFTCRRALLQILQCGHGYADVIMLMHRCMSDVSTPAQERCSPRDVLAWAKAFVKLCTPRWQQAAERELRAKDRAEREKAVAMHTALAAARFAQAGEKAAATAAAAAMDKVEASRVVEEARAAQAALQQQVHRM